MTRDPRIDPQPGDTIFKKVGRTYRYRCVERRKGGDIRYMDSYGNFKSCWITTWQDWAKDAEKMQT